MKWFEKMSIFHGRKKRLVVIGLISILILGILTGCDENKSGTRVVFTTGFGRDEIFRIENIGCTVSEIMVYLTTVQNQYENVYGEEIWNVSLDGVTLEENVKETVLARIAQIKTMYLLALDKEVTLNEKEIELVETVADEYFQSLNEAEKELMGVDREIIENLYLEYALADKVYQQIIRDVNPEISDDEARTITVQHILIRTNGYKDDGTREPYSESAKQAAYEKAKEVKALADAGEQSFEELASKYSEDTTITNSFGKGDREDAYETAAFLLETDEISPVIETSNGYYIIKCVSTFNREETDANKLEIVEKRKNEVFGQEYDQFVEPLVRNLNKDLWNQVTFIRDENVTTSDFFDIYTKYFE